MNHRVARADDLRTSGRGEARGYVHEGVQIVMGATRDPDSGDTLVSIADMGAIQSWSPMDGSYVLNCPTDAISVRPVESAA